MHRSLIVLVLAAIAGCDRSARLAEQAHADSTTAVRSDSIARARQDSINRAQPGYVIDSLLPVEEEIRRFSAAIGGARVTSLGGGSTSRDSLLRRFAKAVEQRDTAAFREMIITAREFIDLVYPESPFTKPPYRHPPNYVWGEIQLTSGKGISRLLERRGGQPLGAVSMLCAAEPKVEGQNRMWNQCQVVTRDPTGQERSERLFGSIIERDGRFKFMSYANQY